MTLAPGATIGILGGGQLGRMLAFAAARLGLRTHVYCPDADSPAFEVASRHTIAAYEDEDALRAFAASVAVVTYEFENVPARTAEVLSQVRPVRPDAAALAASQDRLVEKQFVASLGIATAPFLPVDTAGALPRAVAQFGRPSILKTRRFGYDGKGQTTIKDGSDLAAAFRSLGGGECILEGIVPFTKEVSVICARGLDGGFAAFDVCENVHRGGILHRTVAPAALPPETAAEAVAMARTIADALAYVGVLAVEFFVTEEGGRTKLAVNEMAPRVHNSGHWTEAGAVTSQFEQHIRAICGWPLGVTTRHGASVEMENLIGDEVATWATRLGEPGLCLHLYGKEEARPGRKMGHWTRVRDERA
ncbi:N5-carboxyaminoimidazole ribonucleotide synthase [Beijerinckiaceae bacterium RH AL1]|nr:N5-carboxyaminoimidazole ribonucleotide synthase [Beijerinckiaceae bacterium RH CH11]VVB44503.1 N5-carboxyaminoimidazole ribonucleotide synthase [Beijerinckiaceae bacterium RH AL8]VVC54346.1 N5-carboxyaminoimidazole ribonucleotide synthase [Beijerinckiaceae bacterium RH AL1]